MSLLLMWKQQLLMNNFKYFSLTGSGSLLLPGSIKGKFKELTLSGNSVQGENPAPDNPQEIKSAGRKSKNLFDAKQLQGIPGFEVDGNEITQSAYNISTGKTLKQLCPEIIPGTYFLSTNNGEFSGLFGLTKPFYKNNVIEITEEDLNRIVSLVGALNKTIKFTLQLEKGDKKTDYEPYSDKHFVDLKVTGKNLLSNKSADWQIGKGLSWSTYPNDPISIYRVINSAVNVINLKPSTTYSIVNNSEKIVISRMIERNLSENGIKDHNVRSSKYTFATNQNTMNAILQIKKVDGTELLSTDIEFIKIMLVEGEADENVPYEPYTEQSMQIALDEPLRGVGEYKDTITKDGVVRQIKRIVFDGSEDERWVISNEREHVIHFVSTQFSDATKINEHQRSMMDKLKWSSGVWGRDEIGQDMFAGILRINMPKTLTPDLQTFKTWLSQNPLTVDYVLAEPVTEPLPESVQQQLQALHSENGTTHVFVDSGEVTAEISATYMRK